ncbi:DUF5947 family protein [Streptomyces sp. TRM64462]|uniref:DUF5947 family protein n=1 Tax=Streptomyces sp. TRM64462 TaxID=2741726 RepID=UPI0015867177|nr:DUF5947 family protein [Streptomyces sp. TRM64462]
MTPGALARIIGEAAGDRRRPGGGERCELCGEELPVEDTPAECAPGEHRHLYDTERDEVLCACRPCSLLFVRGKAGDGHYRLVPRRRVRLPPVDTTPLGVPVGLAFFVPHTDGTVTAHYPSPAGATRWETDPGAWQDVVAACPPLGTLAPDVEALLVNTARGGRHHWITPVDDCFRMVAVVRREWRGLSGGGTVWPAVERFFAELTERT